jgi:hypothetical protein
MKRQLLGLVAFTALAGCSATDTGQVKLGVSVAALQSSTIASDATVAAGLSVTRVRILVNVAKVGYTANPGGSGDSADAGPFVVELTGDEITSGAQRQFDLGELASGTYGGAEIEIDRPGSGETSSDPSFADFQAADASVLIDGTYQGTAFTFAGHFLAEQGTDGEVTIDARSLAGTRSHHPAPPRRPIAVGSLDWLGRRGDARRRRLNPGLDARSLTFLRLSTRHPSFDGMRPRARGSGRTPSSKLALSSSNRRGRARAA